MNHRYAQVALRAGHRCEYCHAPEVVFNFPFEVEHIIPMARGGMDIAANWALSCRSCNLWKSAHLQGIDPVSGILIRLFHPREDSWDVHFRADPESGEIHGQTPIGRATVACLRLNHAGQRMARQQWLRLGLFP